GPWGTARGGETGGPPRAPPPPALPPPPPPKGAPGGGGWGVRARRAPPPAPPRAGGRARRRSGPTGGPGRSFRLSLSTPSGACQARGLDYRHDLHHLPGCPVYSAARRTGGRFLVL